MVSAKGVGGPLEGRRSTRPDHTRSMSGHPPLCVRPGYLYRGILGASGHALTHLGGRTQVAIKVVWRRRGVIRPTKPSRRCRPPY
jgi:hypothetical protein